MRARTKQPSSAEVVIISMNPETLDGLQTYLSGAGVTARCTRELEECTGSGPTGPLAFVLFPDDYPHDRIVAVVADLTVDRPKAMAVLVTSHPKRFQKLMEADKVLVVPRPVWGWTILDAVRSHLEAHRAGSVAPPDKEVTRER